MKGKTILGVALTLMLLSSLLFVAPVSAGTLGWSAETIPSTDGAVLLPDSSITDLAVVDDGDTIYAAANTTTIYRSTDRGVTWSSISVSINATFVAVAPDDANYIAIASVDETQNAYVSDDAGATWDPLVWLEGEGPTTINDMALSVEKAGNHFCAVAGVNVSGDNASVWNYEIGAVGAVWEEISVEISVPDGVKFAGFKPGDVVGAVAFSPNFASDEVMVAVSSNMSVIYFQIFSFNKDLWNETGFTGYPVKIAESVHTALDSASISLAPDYLGSDDALRLAFVGVTTNGDVPEDKASGIFRLDDDDVEVLKDDVFIHSIAYDGTNLVAGRYDDTTVYRCDDPLASSPSVKGSASLKSPGGKDLVVVAWAGDDVVAGTSGDESAFAVSRDNGKSFNDISLIDTTLDTLMDVAVSADGSKVYLATANDTDLSLWRYAASWQRVLTVKGAVVEDINFIVRTAPDDADAVYVAEIGEEASDIYYSADGGETRWHTRVSTYKITDDLVVETDGEVVYVLTESGHVSKSINSGFTWASKKSSKLLDGNMLVSVGEDELLAGSKDGYVSYSTDGGTTWTKLDDRMEIGNVQVTASGVTTDDFIYASTDKDGDDIYRWDWADEEWDAIYEDVSTSDNVTGIALLGGVLYAVSANTGNSTSYRTLNPTADTPTWKTMVSDGELFTATPSALRVSLTDDITKLWAVDTATGDNELFSYKDTLAVTAPSLVAPKHGFIDKINPVTGRAMDVTFVWEKPSSKVKGYQLQIALDEGFDEVLRTITVDSDDDKVSQIVGPHGSKDDDGKDAEVEFMPETTYYWKVRVNDPIYSPWSIVYTFSVAEAVAPFPEITVEAPPAAPAPQVTVTPPEITVEVPPITIPAAPAIPAYLLWTIIVIGAVLIIALIVLIVRTRRVV